MDDLVPGLGHNQPPVDPLDKDALLERLQDEHGTLLDRFIELEQGAGRLPAVITSEEQSSRLMDFIAQCRTHTGNVEKAQKIEKAPYLACSRVVDRFFLDRIKSFDRDVIAPASRLGEDYHQRKRVAQLRREAEERQRALEEQRRAEEEAARLAEAARQADRQSAIDLGRQAEEAQERAAAAAAIVEAPSAPTRLHGDYGATGFAKERWRWEITDPTLIPLWALRTNDELINTKIRGGVREIPGLRIWRDDQFIVRKC